MARKRMIDPSLWTDEGMAGLLPRQQLLFIGLFSNADDAGRLKGSPLAIRLMLPTVYSGISEDEIAEDLAEVLAQIRQLSRYVVDGRSYLVFSNYTRWQRIDRPSDSMLPPPPFGEESASIKGDSSSIPRAFVEDSSSPREALDLKGKERNRREIKSEEEETRARARDPHVASAPPPRAPAAEASSSSGGEVTDQFLDELRRRFGAILGEERAATALARAQAQLPKVRPRAYLTHWLEEDVQRYQQEQTSGATRQFSPARLPAPPRAPILARKPFERPRADSQPRGLAPGFG